MQTKPFTAKQAISITKQFKEGKSIRQLADEFEVETGYVEEVIKFVFLIAKSPKH